MKLRLTSSNNPLVLPISVVIVFLALRKRRLPAPSYDAAVDKFLEMIVYKGNIGMQRKRYFIVLSANCVPDFVSIFPVVRTRKVAENILPGRYHRNIHERKV